jgi:hypothetical protein
MIVDFFLLVLLPRVRQITDWKSSLLSSNSNCFLVTLTSEERVYDDYMSRQPSVMIYNVTSTVLIANTSLNNKLIDTLLHIIQYVDVSRI